MSQENGKDKICYGGTNRPVDQALINKLKTQFDIKIQNPTQERVSPFSNILTDTGVGPAED